MEMESNRTRRAEQTKRQRILKTVFLVLVWFCFGQCLEITGPTLIDLKIRFQYDYDEIAKAVSGRMFGFFIGVAIGGVLLDRFNVFCELMMGVGLSGAAVTTALLPLSSVVQHLWFFWFMLVVQGTFAGVTNIVSQKLILNIWKERAASPMHILHGGFGIGSFTIVLIANPFLAIPNPRPAGNLSNIQNNTNVLRMTIHESDPDKLIINSNKFINSTTDIDFVNSKVFKAPDYETEYIRESRIEYAYLISALLIVALSIVFYVYHIIDRKFRKQDKIEMRRSKTVTNKRSFKEIVNPASCAGGNLVYGIEIFFLLFIYFLNIFGGEKVMGQFIRAFAIEQGGFSVDDGSYLNTSLWISITIGRVAGFFAARWIPIRTLILIETGGVFVTSILMNVFAADNSTALWVLTQFLGLFHASCFPTGMGWGDYHVEMTGVAMTFLLLGGSVGGIAYLHLAGYLFQTYGARTFLYHIMGYGITSFALAIMLDLVGAQHGSRFKKSDDVGIDLQEISKMDVDVNLLDNKDKMNAAQRDLP